MMKTHFIWRPYALLLLLALVATSAGGCHWGKDDPPPKQPKPLDALPAESQTGKNSFGCLVNGKPFLPKFHIDGVGGHLSVQPLFSDSSAFINISVRGKFDLGDGFEEMGIGSFRIPLRIPKVPHHFKANPVKDVPNQMSSFSFWIAELGKDGIQVNFYDNTAQDTGTVTITHFDPQKQIISGRFNFEIAHPRHQKLKITNGRFDLKYPF
jgi:hypothetical protein